MWKKVVMWKKIVIIGLLITSGVVGFLSAKARVKLETSLNSIHRENTKALSSVDLDGIQVDSQKDIINILLIGNDYRVEKDGFVAPGLTDVMMIATIDNKHHSLKLTSIMRDTVVDIPGYSENRINLVQKRGGMELLYKTIAQNFHIKLDGYVEVGFDAFETVIDDIGGVELTLSQSEADYLNTTNYISKKKYRHVKVGKQLLNGNQALGFCRIRKHVYTINGKCDDYGRTERQRMAMSAIFDRAKKMSLGKWEKVISKVLGKYVTTDLSNKAIIAYTKDVAFMGTTKVQQLQIPINGYFTAPKDYGNLGSCLIIDKTAQAEAIKQFVFKWNGKGEFNYVPSSSVSSAPTTTLAP